MHQLFYIFYFVIVVFIDRFIEIGASTVSHISSAESVKGKVHHLLYKEYYTTATEIDEQCYSLYMIYNIYISYVFIECL